MVVSDAITVFDNIHVVAGRGSPPVNGGGLAIVLEARDSEGAGAPNLEVAGDLEGRNELLGVCNQYKDGTFAFWMIIFMDLMVL